LSEAKARYIVGLTATAERRDGHHPIGEMQLGPIRFAVRQEAAWRPFAQCLIVRETAFLTAPTNATAGIQDLYAALAQDEARNRLILDDVIAALAEGRAPILLTERTDHLEFFSARLAGFTRNLVVLRGSMGARQQRDVRRQLAAIGEHEERLILATGRFIGEGFDDARLDTLFLALPVSWRGTLVQYTGRLHRLHPGKTDVRIYDYVDRAVPMLLRMFEKRLRGYRAIGYARGEAPLGFTDAREETVVEYDADYSVTRGSTPLIQPG
jgi:superfamily II DNA or RNA helicase